MPRTSIDALLKAIETVGILKDAIAEQNEAIAALAGRLEKLESLVAEVVATPQSRHSGG